MCLLPPPGFFNPRTDQEEKREENVVLEEQLYFNSPETDDVEVLGGRVTYCLHFKYLGSFLSYNLRDDYDISNRILQANKSFGAMKEFYGRPEVTLRSKKLFFRAVQINLLLWGCESWALREELLVKLEVFVRRKIRTILGINRYDMEDRAITKEDHYTLFDNFPRVEALIDTRRMNLLGKIIRDKVSSPPRQMLIAFVSNPRGRGRPLTNNRDSTIESLQRLFKDIPEIHIDEKGSLKDWYLDAIDATYWSQCVARFLNQDLPAPVRPCREFHVNPNVNPRRSKRQQKQNEPKKPKNKTHPSPPRRRGRREENRQRFRGTEWGTRTDQAFQTLGLEPGSTSEEIDQAYRKLSRVYHPDLHNRSADQDGRSTRTGLTLQETTEHMQMLNDTREYLRNL